MAIFCLPAWRRKIAVGLIAFLLLPMVSKADSPAMQSNSDAATEASAVEENQPKFIWGIVLKFAAGKAFEYFSEWASKKLFEGMDQPLTLPRASAVSPPDAGSLEFSAKGAEPVAPNITDQAPAAPLVVKNGKENYQGALLSLLVLQPDGQTYKVRRISEGFKSGEKFRIRVGSTFGGELSLDNINPRGERNRLYPAQSELIVKIKSGVPVILPLDKESFFQFDNVVGEEKLVITLSDPRARGNAVAKTSVHRQESEQGTGLLQEIPAGKYAAIAEPVALQHRQ